MQVIFMHVITWMKIEHMISEWNQLQNMIRYITLFHLCNVLAYFHLQKEIIMASDTRGWVIREWTLKDMGFAFYVDEV